MDTHTDAIISRVSRTARIATRLSATVLLFALMLPAPANAGTFTVTACNDAPGGANNSWVPFNADPVHLQTRLSCPYTINEGQLASQENGIATTDILDLPDGAKAGAQAGWTFKVPDPESEKITGISYDRMFSTQDQYWIPALRADGGILPGQTCSPPIAGSCLTGSGPGGENHASITGLSAETLTLGLECIAPTGQECITGADDFHATVATMYAAEVTIEDNTPPTLQPPTGPLWENTSYHKGTENLTITAQDTGSGVQRIILAADGTPVDTYEAQCNFTFPKPCPSSSEPQTLTLPTTTLADGRHTLTLTAIDAAGNESIATSKIAITVVNHPPPPPVGLSATQVGSSTFTADWDDPTGQVAPITEATYQICPTTGTASCSSPVSAPAGGPATGTVPGPGTWTLFVWLSNIAGGGNPAQTTLSIPAGPPTSSSNDSSGNSSHGDNYGGKGSGSSGGSAQERLHVTETLHGRKLTLLVTGPSSGAILVSYTGRYRGKQIASAAKNVSLRHGKATVTFTLTERAAKYAKIRVMARLRHEQPVRSTLPRRH